MKKDSETSLLIAGIYALMLMAFGSFLGFLCLMSFPLQGYSSVQEQLNAQEQRESHYSMPGEAYYIEGPTLGSSTWESRRTQLIDGSAPTITVSAGEINAWLAAKFRPGVNNSSEEDNGLVIEPARPNVGITQEGAVYLNLPARISVYGIQGNYVLSARVSYAGGNPARLRIHQLQVGGAPVPFPRVLGARIFSALVNGFRATEEYPILREAWGRVDSVEVVDGNLVLNLKNS